MSKPIVVSGMQPTGPIHLGNYLGAIKNWVDIQNSGKYDSWFFVADYHSLTENYDPQAKKEQIFELVCEYLAAGLDPAKSTIFIQSQVPECAELAWIFNTVTPVSELERMTQFKDKALRQKKNINMGLFDYPVLQAADILLYHGALVPVGQDQIQHVELTRDVARWFNNKYQTDYFPESRPLLTPTPKIMDLLDPESKMSKSLGDKHWLGIGEAPEAMAKKISKAVTTPAGVDNLRALYQAFETEMKEKFDAQAMARTKTIIADGVAKYFGDFRRKKAELMKNKKATLKILEAGRERASAVAKKTISEVKEIVGLI